MTPKRETAVVERDGITDGYTQQHDLPRKVDELRETVINTGEDGVASAAGSKRQVDHLSVVGPLDKRTPSWRGCLEAS